MMFRCRLAVAFVGCVGLAIAEAARADILAYEQFIYPAGVANINGLNGGAGWSGPWSGNHILNPDAGLETLFNQYPLPSGQPTTTAASPRGGYIFNPCERQTGATYGLISVRGLAQPINMGQDGVYYFSFLFRRNTVVTDCSGLHPAYNNMRCVVAFLSGGSHPVNDAELVFGSDIFSSGGSDSLDLFLWGTPQPGTEPAGDTLTNNTTFQIVGKIVAGQTGYDQVFFERYRPGGGIDPQEPEWDKFCRPALNNAVLDRFCIYGEAPLAVDEIRIGTTFAAVTGEVLPVMCSAFAPADADGDCDVDLNDYARFRACFTGPTVPQNNPGCSNARLDGDNDVDLEDFWRFQRCMSGQGVAASPGCGD